ncbi:4'-phosphopantetheinyl transferase family protein [Humibacillus xanthopallidus]|uniref:4'-phosphopantetheinyl transferase family protein n=1 Tax=Humibacillus xanthopallidus TaxID=412689 RepID=UPI00163A9387|nr:4'-phosphopantetheinyl transferase superfamily protein [Humibacillus xanthopallidus]
MPPSVPPRAPDAAPASGVGRADAWFAHPGRSVAWERRLGPLDPLERGRLAALREPMAARAYAVLHVLARDVLGQVVGAKPGQLVFDRTCARCGDEHGSPRLVGHPGVHVSLSRTPDLVAVAVSTDAPVGVDVERVAATRFAGFDGVAMHPSERSRDLDDAARAVSWVRKEAALKALGAGFVVDPAALRTPQPGRAVLVLPDRPPVTVVDLPLGDGGHVGALALAAAYGTVEVTAHEAPGD